MNIKKKIIGHLNKCYSMAPLRWNNKDYILVAAEKQDACYLYDLEGNKIDTIWEGPGGVMTMQQIPGTNGEFLATQKFYSPNDSAEAYLALVQPTEKGWSVKKMVDIPFVHRFGILERNGVNYLIACALKSDHQYKNDWTSPGVVYGTVLPEDLENKTIELKPLMSGLLKNHGYSLSDGKAVIGTENGTFLFTPPAEKDGEWEIEKLLDIPSSDSVLIDLDGDGKLELGVIAPFHGNSITIFHLDEHGRYVPQWKYEKPESETEMVHGTWAGKLGDKNVWAAGWRKGTRSTILIFWNKETDTYDTVNIDTNAGAANLLHYKDPHGHDVLMATNREIDEIATYTITQ